jgi:hypothetical protein
MIVMNVSEEPATSVPSILKMKAVGCSETFIKICKSKRQYSLSPPTEIQISHALFARSLDYIQLRMRSVTPPISRLLWVSLRRASSHHQDLTVDGQACPLQHDADELATARPYSEVPGPTPLPLIGNTWRLLPIIGTCIANIASNTRSRVVKQNYQIIPHISPHPLQFIIHELSHHSALYSHRHVKLSLSLINQSPRHEDVWGGGGTAPRIPDVDTRGKGNKLPVG